MYCAKCGAHVQDEASFCSACGYSIKTVGSPEPSQPPLVSGGDAVVVTPTEAKAAATSQRSVFKRIVLALLWIAVIGVSAEFVILTFGESPRPKELGGSLFFGYGFLAAMYAKRRKFLWFFLGGVAAIIVFGVLNGLIRRAIHGLPLLT